MPERTKALTVAELERVNHASATAQDRVNHALSKAAVLAGDGEQARRLEQRECARCFYLSVGLVGHAFTKWQCSLCGTEGEHANTGVPRVCDCCADTYGLCTRCGGDIEMKFRTKRFGRRARRRGKAVANA